MDTFCHPRASPKDIDGRRSEKGLKPELSASDVTCTAHFAGSHCLGNGPFYPGSFGIHRAKLRGPFSVASLLKRPIRLFIGL